MDELELDLIQCGGFGVAGTRADFWTSGNEGIVLSAHYLKKHFAILPTKSNGKSETLRVGFSFKPGKECIVINPTDDSRAFSISRPLLQENASFRVNNPRLCRMFHENFKILDQFGLFDLVGPVHVSGQVAFMLKKK